MTSAINLTTTDNKLPECEIILAGFGGQGVLFAGKLLSYMGLLQGAQVSWMPSYGPEMRGGTANCSVVISGHTIGSPLVVNPDILVAMNAPSFEEFIGDVKPDGLVVADAGMVESCPMRTDVQFSAIASTDLADNNKLEGLGNVILVGHLLSVLGFTNLDLATAALVKTVSARKQDLIESNKAALSIGFGALENEDCHHVA